MTLIDKLGLWTLVLVISIGGRVATATKTLNNCKAALSKSKFEKKNLDKYFKISETVEDNDAILILKWTEGSKLSQKQHRELYLKTAALFDDLLLSGRCEPEAKRLVAIYPPISYSIASSELKAIRIYKRESPMWKSQILVRSTVVPIK
jgi:hypothetical protein